MSVTIFQNTFYRPNIWIVELGLFLNQFSVVCRGISVNTGQNPYSLKKILVFKTVLVSTNYFSALFLRDFINWFWLFYNCAFYRNLFKLWKELKDVIDFSEIANWTCLMFLVKNIWLWISRLVNYWHPLDSSSKICAASQNIIFSNCWTNESVCTWIKIWDVQRWSGHELTKVRKRLRKSLFMNARNFFVIRIQTFVQSCPGFGIFTRILCGHVQKFNYYPDHRAFIGVSTRVIQNARRPPRAFILVWSYLASVGGNPLLIYPGVRTGVLSTHEKSKQIVQVKDIITQNIKLT